MTRPGAKAGGFTLLEVMVAVAILGLALTVIAEAQTRSMRASATSKRMTIATLLARQKMVELEEELFEEGFSEFTEEKTGDFAEQGRKDFSYVLKVEKLNLPQSLDQDAVDKSLGGIGGGSPGSGPGGGAGGAGSPLGMVKLGGKLLSRQFEMFRNVLEQSIRRVTLTVKWKEGSRTRKFALSAFYTDTRTIDSIGALTDSLQRLRKGKGKGKGKGGKTTGKTGLPGRGGLTGAGLRGVLGGGGLQRR